MDSKKDTHTGLEVNEKGFSRFILPLSDTIYKAERLAIAIHLITDFVPEEEFLRTILRKESLELIADSVAGTPEKVHSRIRRLLSLIAVARGAGFISNMNADLLSGEHQKLLLASVGGQGVFVTDFFKAPFKGNEYSKGHKGQSRQKDISRKKDTVRALGGDTDRRASIVALFFKKDSLTVKDVSSVIAGYSEKTLQRELVSMVRDGVLKKEGERRWSRYFLSKPRSTLSPEVQNEATK